MKAIFDRQNPWRRPGFTFYRKQYIHRKIHNSLIRHLDKKEISVLVGSRQIGKTFTIQKLIEHLLTNKEVKPEQIFYFNLDAIELVELVRNENLFIEFINLYCIKDQRSFIFLDEAQRIPECGLLLKRLYDLNLDFKLVVSGSSSLEIKSQVKETLTGRKQVFEMLPISFKEFLIYKNIDLSLPFDKKIEFESEIYHHLLNEFLLFGGYPGVVKLEHPEDKIQLLYEIYSSYVQKDISDFLKVHNILDFNRLVYMLSAQNTGLLKNNELYRITGISRYYIELYLRFLEETYVIQRLRPYYRNFGKTIIKTPKMYFIDTGIYNTVFKQFQDIENRADKGRIVENFVFSELAKSIKIDNMWFYRTNTGSKIDFIINHNGRLELIEVKYSITRQQVIPKIFHSIFNKLNPQKSYILTKNYTADNTFSGIPVSFRPVYDIFELF